MGNIDCWETSYIAKNHYTSRTHCGGVNIIDKQRKTWCVDAIVIVFYFMFAVFVTFF